MPQKKNNEQPAINNKEKKNKKGYDKKQKTNALLPVQGYALQLLFKKYHFTP